MTTETSRARARFLALGLLLATVACLPACATRQSPHPVQAPVIAAAPDPVREWLRLQRAVLQLDADALTRERTRLMAAAEAPAAPVEVLRRALLLAHLPDPDLATALALLDTLRADASPDAAPWHDVATLLAENFRLRLTERDYLRTLGEFRQRQWQEKFDAQQKHIRDLQRAHDQLRQELAETQQKLEALKSIEMNLPVRAGGDNGERREAP